MEKLIKNIFALGTFVITIVPALGKNFNLLMELEKLIMNGTEITKENDIKLSKGEFLWRVHSPSGDNKWKGVLKLV